jgi:hypothetical protein
MAEDPTPLNLPSQIQSQAGMTPTPQQCEHYPVCYLVGSPTGCIAENGFCKYDTRSHPATSALDVLNELEFEMKESIKQNQNPILPVEEKGRVCDMFWLVRLQKLRQQAGKGA